MFKVAASLLLLGASAHEGHGAAPGHRHFHGDGFNGTEVGDKCGTEVDPLEMLEAEAIAQRFHHRVCSHENLTHVRMCQPNEIRLQTPVTIPVWYHVIHDGANGRLTQQTVQAQFDQTNLDFSGQEDPRIPGAAKMDITFSLAGTTYTDNRQWFSNMDRFESSIKNALAVDSTKNFNQYFGNLGQGLLGFCYFPNSFPENSPMHGCMNLFSSVPGGSATNYNQGKTTTHETGHGIGLFHTFQGGCNGGDSVADTCNQASPTSGCPSSRNSCANNGCMDPIHNYMDYSFDSCMTQFTDGQNTRANQQLSTFRPSLYTSDSDRADILAVFPDAWEEPRAHQAKAQDRYMARRLAKGYQN